MIMIVQTSGWRHLKEENKFPGRKWLNFFKFPKSKMENPISPLLFKKSNYVI